MDQDILKMIRSRILNVQHFYIAEQARLIMEAPVITPNNAFDGTGTKVKR